MCFKEIMAEVIDWIIKERIYKCYIIHTHWRYMYEWCISCWAPTTSGTEWRSHLEMRLICSRHLRTAYWAEVKAVSSAELPTPSFRGASQKKRSFHRKEGKNRYAKLSFSVGFRELAGQTSKCAHSRLSSIVIKALKKVWSRWLYQELQDGTVWSTGHWFGRHDPRVDLPLSGVLPLCAGNACTY